MKRGRSMKEKKGFTLVELLAVIIILAIISVIATPLVLNLVENQKKNTFKESIYGILRSSKISLVSEGFTYPATYTYSNGVLLNPNGKEIKIQGKIIEGSGTVIYSSDTLVQVAIKNDKWCATYHQPSSEVQVNILNGPCEIES